MQGTGTPRLVLHLAMGEEVTRGAHHLPIPQGRHHSLRYQDSPKDRLPQHTTQEYGERRNKLSTWEYKIPKQPSAKTQSSNLQAAQRRPTTMWLPEKS